MAIPQELERARLRASALFDQEMESACDWFVEMLNIPEPTLLHIQDWLQQPTTGPETLPAAVLSILKNLAHTGFAVITDEVVRRAEAAEAMHGTNQKGSEDDELVDDHGRSDGRTDDGSDPGSATEAPAASAGPRDPDVRVPHGTQAGPVPTDAEGPDTEEVAEAG